MVLFLIMFSARRIDYEQTGYFTPIVIDYLKGEEKLKPFYSYSPNLDGMRQSIKAKESKQIDREVLAEVLASQYEGIKISSQVKENLQKLKNSNCFTICTAHQPNLFTGPLYFMYKIVHAIKLAHYLQAELKDYSFVPVYYMGSEDADFDELNHTWVEGKKLEWKKESGGAVGRMKVDGSLIKLIDELEGQLGIHENGKETIQILRNAYREGRTIQEATFEIVNALYGAYGLIVLIPDHPALKKKMHSIFSDDLFNNTPSEIVAKSSTELALHYNVQAHPREINLFYLKDNIRERIAQKENDFEVLNTDIKFSRKELEQELESHPERFSPNVILRGIFQETILPNIAFIGGGGELAYWLQLKTLFQNYMVPFPLLILRNSFLVVEQKWKQKTEALGLSIDELFKKEEEIITAMSLKGSEKEVLLNGSIEAAESLYERIREQANKMDPSLSEHVLSIKAKAFKSLEALQKKMIRAQKRKFTDQRVSVQKLRETLFPGDGLQERKENFSVYYSKWGNSFIEGLYQKSPSLDQQFTILLSDNSK